MKRSLVRKNKSKPAAWQEHEDHVAAMYRLLGYRVTSNVHIQGKQADLECEKWIAGAGRVLLYIDCKYTNLALPRSVTNVEVDNFIAAFHNRKTLRGWTTGVLLSNVPFTQYAKESAQHHSDICLKTLSELYEDFFQPRAYLYSLIHTYKADGVLDNYVPLQTRPLDENLSPSGPARDLMRAVNSWLESDLIQLCLLGDFGSGKTTFLRHLHCRLAENYLAGTSSRIPLLITLREYYDAKDGEELLLRFLSRELAVAPPIAIFDYFLRRGLFVLLFDGFDEMGKMSNAHSRRQNYLKLARYFSSGAKIAISCRPAYFVTKEELQTTFSFLRSQIGFVPHANRGKSPLTDKLSELSLQLSARLGADEVDKLFNSAQATLSKDTAFHELQLFNDAQVLTYLKNLDHQIATESGGRLDASKLFNRIKDVYDLEDLARRPILLKLIANTLPLFKPSEDGTYVVTVKKTPMRMRDITPSLLYYVYTEEEFRREYEKGEVRWLVEREVKRQIVATLAFHMLLTNSLAVEPSDFQTAMRPWLSPNPETTDYVLTDIRTCSFLVRDPQNCIRFTHKSFLEYFAAEYILPKLTNTKSAAVTLSETLLSDEVLYFLGDSVATFYPGSVPVLHELNARLVVHDKVRDRTCKHNVLNLLASARQLGNAIQDVSIDSLRLRKLEFRTLTCERCSFQTLELHRVSVRTFTLDQCTCERISMYRCNLEETSFSGGRWAQLILSECVGTIHVQSLRIEDIQIIGGQLEKLTFEDCVLGVGVWRGVEIEICEFRSCVVSGNDAQHVKGTSFTSLLFVDCILLDLDCNDNFLSRAVFRNCTFVRCVKNDERDVRRLEGSRGVLINTRGVEECRFVRPNCPFLWTHKQALRPVKYEIPDPSWEDLLAKTFPIDGEHYLPDTPTSFRNRLESLREGASQMRRTLAHQGDTDKTMILGILRATRKTSDGSVITKDAELDSLIKSCEKNLQRRADDHAVLCRLGNALKIRAEITDDSEALRFSLQAEAQYRKALALRPDFHEALCNLALLLAERLDRRLGDDRELLLRDAKLNLSEALRVLPDCPYAQVLMVYLPELDETEQISMEAGRRRTVDSARPSALPPEMARKVAAWGNVLTSRAKERSPTARAALLRAAHRCFEVAGELDVRRRGPSDGAD